MNVTELSLPGVKLIEPKIFGDHRGHFLETWNAQRYAEIGIGPFVQDNLSRSVRGTVRGLHLQNDPNAQGKLVHCVAGAVWDVVAEVRKGHPNFGKWLGVELTADNRRQLWVPRGYAHGFAVLSDVADFAYKVDAPYSPKDEVTVRWDDPALKIDWKIDPGTVLLAPRDAAAAFLG